MIKKFCIKLIKCWKTHFYTFLAVRQLGSYQSKPRVNYKSKFSKQTHLGFNCHFNGLVVEGGGKVTIGNNFHSGKDILFITQNHNYDKGNAIPYDNTYYCEEIKIGDNVWLGTRTIILPGAVIEEGAIIQAGSVVTGLIPYCAIAGGHPAKVFKYRDKKHYAKLKTLKRFQ
jgi:acetyltransferase-like isoleucine patch superfamily enzyme